MSVKIYNSRGITSSIRISKKNPFQDSEYAPVEPQEPSYELPTWISSGDLGTYEQGSEVAIVLEYHDPSNVVDTFSLIGSLPSGVVFNDVGGTLSGYIEDTTSNTYNFTITIYTIYGDNITESFSISSLVTESTIVWHTDSDLGTYDSGQSVNQDIDATVEETTV